MHTDLAELARVPADHPDLTRLDTTPPDDDAGSVVDFRIYHHSQLLGLASEKCPLVEARRCGPVNDQTKGGSAAQARDPAVRLGRQPEVSQQPPSDPLRIDSARHVPVARPLLRAAGVRRLPAPAPLSSRGAKPYTTILASLRTPPCCPR
jgi:hypothetical protein